MYCDVGPSCAFWAPPRAWADMRPEDWDAFFMPGVPHDDGQEGRQRFYLLSPLNGRMVYSRMYESEGAPAAIRLQQA